MIKGSLQILEVLNTPETHKKIHAAFTDPLPLRCYHFYAELTFIKLVHQLNRAFRAPAHARDDV